MNNHAMTLPITKIKAPDATMNELMRQHTQLPDGVPHRVRDLALQLTENQANWYDKVKAVENYFDQPQFIYSKENIPYPSKDQDYVDQFLFETKIGYCDNFSSSMVVLLRGQVYQLDGLRDIRKKRNVPFIEVIPFIESQIITRILG